MPAGAHVKASKIFFLIFLGLLFLNVVSVHLVMSQPQYAEIHISTDGSVTGTDKIQRNGNTYTFIENIKGSIAIDKDNVVIDGAGHTLSGPSQSQYGISILYRNGITIRNAKIADFSIGIWLAYSSNNTIYGNTANVEIDFNSTNNKIIQNHLTSISSNSYFGIKISELCLNNFISNNLIANNPDGIDMYNSDNNTIIDNTIANSTDYGLNLQGGSFNFIARNNIINNKRQVSGRGSGNNTWYANYWSDHVDDGPYLIQYYPFFPWINYSDTDYHPAATPYAGSTVTIPAYAENSWTTKTPMLTSRSGLGVAVVNGKIYAIGGDDGNSYLDVNEEYDPATNTWVSKKPMPSPRSRFGITVYQNKIYVMGGANQSRFTGANEVYDPATDTWEIKTSMPAGGRSELAVNAIDGKIYAIGGYFLGVYWIPSNLTEVYDPETDMWTTKASMPTAVYGCTSAVVGNKIYVIENSYSGEIHNLRLNQIYNVETDTWSYGQRLPVRTAEAAAVATTGIFASKRIYVIGGGEVSATGLNQVYDPETDTWTTGVQMPTPRQSLGVAVVNDMLYAIGGGYYIDDIFTATNKNEEYTPFGYGTVSPDTTPPAVSVVSPENKTYSLGDVPLTFTASEFTSWIGYSLDGQANVTIAGNTTLTGLSDGMHIIIIYASDTAGNISSSETIYFSIKSQQSEPFPITWIAAITVIITIGVALTLVTAIYRKRWASNKKP